jgi:outer membrane protein OmpA-like peptidoglycan-associated protein
MKNISISAITLLLTFGSGCVHPTGLKSQSDTLHDLILQANESDARLCAPRQMALAESNSEFVDLEFQQGDPRRAQEHLDVALGNIRAAISLVGTCGPRDSDHDGIMDDYDACPEQAEDMDGYQDEDGCPEGDPPVLDADGDGLLDDVDTCPNEPEDLDGFEDDDGCPDLDNDFDTVLDQSDDCPLNPEDPDGWQDEDGCPDPDNDGDGIADEDDDCPLEAENVNQYFDDDGCPDEKPELVQVVREQIVIQEKIQFSSGRATILSASHTVLNAVVQVLNDYPSVTIRIEGHTDSQGGDDLNQRLSERRAQAVLDYIMSQGISSVRMDSLGFGETRPVASNRNPDGRAENRRVEFHITGGLD